MKNKKKEVIPMEALIAHYEKAKKKMELKALTFPKPTLLSPPPFPSPPLGPMFYWGWLPLD